ncbi:MAG TPA: hypothetical protein VEZ14_10655 [Dehalococcoidia bacterium]|nr:hypothetical protein [Dehalococcoidia bacterium]
MTRALARPFAAGLLAAIVALSLGCSAARSVRDRITGAGTPAPIRTPTHTPTITPTPTPTFTPTPTATPTPVLPQNPAGLDRWDTLPIPYCVSTGGAGYVSNALFVIAVQRAFTAWGVPTRYTGQCGPPKQDDGINEIGWGALNSERAQIYEAGITLRITSQCRSNCDPNDRIRLAEADITVDSHPPAEFRTANCLYATLLHETGHFLGLEHLPAPSVMEAETSGCRTQLTAADRQALLARYGARAHPQ